MADRQQRRMPIRTVVRRTQWLSDSMVRVVLTGDDLAGFGPPMHADAYVKLHFLRPGVDYGRPLDLELVRQRLPAADWPRQRTYTVRAFDPGARELTIDFVVHGDQGLAGPWAASAVPGDEMYVLGPGGGYTPGSDVSWLLLVGDESALPAVAAVLERLPAGATAQVLLEVPGPADEVPLEVPTSATVRWVHRGARPVGEQLVRLVAAAARPQGTGEAFVHGEAAFVRDVRRLLRGAWAMPSDRLSVSGYWRAGADDEAWRAVKREWNADVEAEDPGAVEVLR